MSEHRCAKCDGAMGEGFVIDSTDYAARVARWVEGAPAYGLLRILKTRGRRELPVRTFRCTKCGYLESYAKPERG